MLKLPKQDGYQKLSTILQMIFFLAVMIFPYLLLRKVIHALILRILSLIVLYILSALLTYCVLRPILMRAEAACRRKKKQIR